MPYTPHTIPPSLDKVLVIDEMPLVSLAFQEVFRTINTAATVAYTESIFTALSAREYADMDFGLVIAGSLPDHYSQDLALSVAEIRQRFAKARVMIYAIQYDPQIIENMEAAGISAYVHKYEPLDEIRKTYTRLSAGQSHVSEIFRTLYHEYGLHREQLQSMQPGRMVPVSELQQRILSLICEGRTAQEAADALSIPCQEVMKELNAFHNAMRQ